VNCQREISHKFWARLLCVHSVGNSARARRTITQSGKPSSTAMVAIVLVPSCPSTSLTSVAAVDCLVASWPCKRPSSTPPESLFRNRQPSQAWPIQTRGRVSQVGGQTASSRTAARVPGENRPSRSQSQRGAHRRIVSAMAITGSHARARYQKIVSAVRDSPKAVTCRTRLPHKLAVADLSESGSTVSSSP
jgi:hypothetical protein